MLLPSFLMPSHRKSDRPLSRVAFEAEFPDDAARGGHPFAPRWPDGFVCPECDCMRAWKHCNKRLIGR